MHATKMGREHPAHPGGGAHVGVLDVLGVHDEQGDGVWGLVFLMLVGPVVALIGVQAGNDSLGMPGAKLVLEVERYPKALGGQLPHGVGCDGRLSPVVGPV